MGKVEFIHLNLKSGVKYNMSENQGFQNWVERNLDKIEHNLDQAATHRYIDCNKQAYHWSNIDHSYKRALEDYSPRCFSCYHKYDKNLC